ncbi:TPA: DUF551 domain-containing protein [Escherichia coli]|nr:DUF551 domain-containing protein [Escherichia coli]
MTTITKEFTKEQLIEQAKKNIEVLRGAVERVPGASDAAVIHLKLAEITLASLEAEPVAVNDDMAYAFHHALSDSSLGTDEVEEIKVGLRAAFANVTAQPVPVVPGEIADDLMEKLPKSDAWANGFRGGWNACRAVMLQGSQPVSQTYKLHELSGNYPVTPDGWISCSERMPEKGQNVLISVNFDSSLVEPLICSARYTGSTFRRGDATIKLGNGIEQATHWMPLPEPPQEVNRG